MKPTFLEEIFLYLILVGAGSAIGFSTRFGGEHGRIWVVCRIILAAAFIFWAVFGLVKNIREHKNRE